MNYIYYKHRWKGIVGINNLRGFDADKNIRKEMETKVVSNFHPMSNRSSLFRFVAFLLLFNITNPTPKNTLSNFESHHFLIL
jgi:hypothetical protein